jgi:hypothetical protein
MNKAAVTSKSNNIVPIAQPLASSPEVHISKTLNKFNYTIDHLLPEMRNYVVYRMFQMAESEDAMTSLKGIEMLARLEWVSLFKDKIEISISTKSDNELRSELAALAVKVGYIPYS